VNKLVPSLQGCLYAANYSASSNAFDSLGETQMRFETMKYS